jgi:hypothetical protein
MNDQLERNLTDRLRAIADHAPAGGGWDAIHGRIAGRQRARGRRRAAVAAVMVVAIAGGLASTIDGDGRRQVVAGPPPAPAALPRLVLDLDGYTVVGATELAEAPLEAARGGSLTVLARPDAGLSGPALFVRTVPEGAQYGFGEQSPIARTVDIGGVTGYVQPYTSLARSLGWRLEDGSGVPTYQVTGTGGSDEIHAVDLRQHRDLGRAGRGRKGRGVRRASRAVRGDEGER